MKPQPQSDLIFDLGLHKGEDTDYYLKKGFRVLAVEANECLVAHCRGRFEKEISQGRLTIVEGAIAAPSEGNQLTFYVNPTNTVWGTIYPEIAKKKAAARETVIVPITVYRIDLDSLFRDHGVPHYLKVDIEGADILVVDALRRLDNRPRFISMEKLGDCLQPLSELGYKRFRIVPQGKFFGRKLTIRLRSGESLDYLFEEECSGPYGEDLDLPWVTLEECKLQAAKIKRLKEVWSSNAPKGSRFPGWYDTHASF